MQQELLSLHRRIEAADTTLGILVAAGLALLLYAMGNKHEWRPHQMYFVLIALVGTIICSLALFFITNDESDWLNFRTFDESIHVDPAHVLTNTLTGGKDAYRTGVLVELSKQGFGMLGLLVLAVGATGYMAFGQKEGARWFFWGWGSLVAIGVVRSIVVRVRTKVKT
jgi:hypothetical protein